MEYNQIIQGDSLTVLKTLPDETFNCCVTSPPYWGLRDYGIEPVIWDGVEGCEHEWGNESIKITQPARDVSGGFSGKDLRTRGNQVSANAVGGEVSQGNFCLKCGAWRGSLGLEPTFELYIKHLCDIFDEVKRVLRKDGTCWVNLGDSYASNGGASRHFGYQDPKYKNGRCGNYIEPSAFRQSASPKSLCLIPQRFAIEMVNRGWILRNTIIWHKPNCMPSSAKDRFTVDFEYVYFFVKSKKYWFEQAFEKQDDKELEYRTKLRSGKKYNCKKPYQDNTPYINLGWASNQTGYNPQGRNKRAVWTIPLDDELLALEQLADRLAEYKQQHDVDIWWLEEEVAKLFIDYQAKRAVWKVTTKPFKEAHFATFPEALIKPMIQAGCPKGGVVLDPFIGSGTTAKVAKKQGKRYLGIEIKQEYIDMANRGINAIPENLF